MYNPLLCYPPPLHYCWGRCCPFFLYGWLRVPLLCYRPPQYSWATLTALNPYTAPRLNAACFGAMSVGVLGEPSLCYPPTLHLNQMLIVLVRCASAGWATLHCAASLHCTWVKCYLFWCDVRRRVGRPFTVLPLYTAPRLNAACFGAMSGDVLDDDLLCCPPTLHDINADCFGAMGVGVLGNAFMC